MKTAALTLVALMAIAPSTRIWVKAAISGTTLLLDNYSFGSTRGASDYESAAKAAL
jgi:hypothetical protein